MRKKLVALLVTAILSFTLAVSVFAEGAQYKTGEYVTYAGHTDFDYYFTYSVEKTNTNYKCFSVVEADGQRVYAAVKESLYEYYKNVFNDQDVTFRGAAQRIADDGAPVILATWKVTNEEGKENLTSLEEDVAPTFYKEGTAPDFKLFYDLYGDLTVSVAEDDSYMTIDNNPLNLKGGSIIYNELGLNHVKLTNKALGLPDWLYQEMGNTRAIDGRQKESFDDVTVTWSYHPNQGLEVIYRTNH